MNSARCQIHTVGRGGVKLCLKHLFPSFTQLYIKLHGTHFLTCVCFILIVTCAVNMLCASACVTVDYVDCI